MTMLDKIKLISESEYPRIYNQLNKYDKPEELKEFFPNNYPENIGKNIEAMLNFLRPSMSFIEETIGQKELLKYHHLNNLGSTEKEYEKWWEENKVAAKALWNLSDIKL